MLILMFFLFAAEPCPVDACSIAGDCHMNDDFTTNCTCHDTFVGDDCSSQYCADLDIICNNRGFCP